MARYGTSEASGSSPQLVDSVVVEVVVGSAVLLESYLMIPVMLFGSELVEQAVIH